MRDLCFIDVETTGLCKTKNEIIEIALIRTSPQLEKKIDFHARVFPEHIETANPRALEINHYDEERWAQEAHPLSEILQKVLSITEDCILAGHNVSFDRKFLKAAVEKCGEKPNWNYHMFDTSILAIPFLAEKRIRNLSLGSLLSSFSIKKDKTLHSAKNDIEYTLELAKKMYQSLKIVSGPPRLKALMVAIEGIDGVGKSHLIQTLLQKLEEYSLQVGTTEEPTRESKEGNLIRSHKERLEPESELKLFMEDRRKHRPVLDILRNTRDVVILDRYYLSSMAYQGQRLSEQTGLDLTETMARIQTESEILVPKPDLVLILDADPTTAIQRLLQRGRGQDGFEQEENLRKVREAFKAIKEKEMLGCHVTIIDTCQLSQEEVVEVAFKEVKRAYFG